MTTYTTAFGAIDNFDKGGVEVINDDARNYVFSNVFEVAASSAPYEKVAVAKNLEYVIEVIRAEGTSGWRAAPHDEFALVMDGEVRVEFIDPAEPQVDPAAEGSVGIDGEPAGTPMGHVVARRGHMVMLPAGRCYRMHADRPSTVLLQTIFGPDTVEKWAQICQTM